MVLPWESNTLRTLLIALGLVSLATMLPAPVAAQCNPVSGQAAFFVDDQYHGQCVLRGIGDYPTATSIGLPNDSITSIRLGPGTQVYACRDHYFQGTCELITSSDTNLSNNAIGNDTITSVRVQAAGASTSCTPAPNQVGFFIDANFTGGCQLRGIGEYPTSDAIGLPNDSISSFRVGSGAQVIVCLDVNYGGNCQLFASSVANMGSTSIGNDQISSAKVQALGVQNCQPGPQQIGFFMHDNFVPPCSLRGLGMYPNAGTLGLPNDSISSILVGPSAQTVACVDVNFGGDCQRFTTSQSHLGSTRIGNDRISSARVQGAGEADCIARPGQVAFFVNDDMVGPCSVRGIGDYPTADAIGIANDSMSSVIVGSGAQVALCVDTNYGNDCQKFTTNDGHLGNDRIGNDRVSSARVQSLGTLDCPPGTNQAAVYMHADFLAPCTVKGVGDYANSTAIGLADNSISSIRVSSSVQVCGCDGENFTTQCESYPSSTGYLGNFNDAISSMKVAARGATCQAMTTTPQGVKTALISNCHSEKRSVNIWTYDATIGAYADKGSAGSNWSSSGSCPVGAPFTVTLTEGHQMQIIAVDPQGLTCGGQNDPSISGCQKLVTGYLLGDNNGTTVQFQIN